MQSEDFDSKVRQAAEQHHPNYDEKAWSKMETLLDKHLPPKKDRRRRIIFFLFTFLLLVGGAWLFIDKPWQQDRLLSNKTNTKEEVTLSPDSSPAPEKATAGGKEHESISPESHHPEVSLADAATVTKNEVSADDNSNTIAGTAAGDQQQKNQYSKSNRKKDTDNSLQVEVVQGNTGIRKQTPGVTQPVDKQKQETGSSEKKSTEPVTDKTVIAKTVPAGNKNDQPVLAVNDQAAKNKTSLPVKDSTVELPTAKTEKALAKKSSNTKANTFFFSLSAGPDISSVGLGNPGKVKLLTGVGVGYTFKDRLTIRTGFYSSRKIYEAKPADYKPSVAPINPAYLQSISADCKVYEIPLNLSYHFGRSAKHSAFASAGLSSFLMKKETYDYLYEYPGSAPYHYIHIVDNENKHYFSVLTLSGGYQRKISKMLSVTAEPYLKLPLAGVGYGKIKLNSFGVLFSVNISPFKAAAK